jgi:hypothetical protein
MARVRLFLLHGVKRKSGSNGLFVPMAFLDEFNPFHLLTRAFR